MAQYGYNPNLPNIEISLTATIAYKQEMKNCMKNGRTNTSVIATVQD